MKTQPEINEAEQRKAERLEFIKSLGLDYQADFVPWSRSRNAKEKDPSINWKVTISKGNQHLTTDYMQGVGHLPNYSHQFARLAVYTLAVNEACETGKSRLVKHKNGHDACQEGIAFKRGERIPPPELQDVLYSLVMDSEAIEYSTFEEWASTYGYETDSRKAEAIYRACLEIGLKLRSMLGGENMDKLRELFQDY